MVRTRSKSFFADKNVKESATLEKLHEEMKKKFRKLVKKRKFCGTKPLKQLGKKFTVEDIELKNVRILDIISFFSHKFLFISFFFQLR